MLKNNQKSKSWYHSIASNRRKEMLEILTKISRLHQSHKLSFIIVGACSLVIRDCLKYVAWWDVDLLFKSPEEIEKFKGVATTNRLKIFPIDEKIIDYGYLSSFQTMWGLNNVWYRVDYIYRENYYLFHSQSPLSSIIFQERVLWKNKSYSIEVPVAHPWNMFIDKLLSPRFEFDLKNRDSFSIDIRHLFILLEMYQTNPEFWQYLSSKTAEFNIQKTFKINLENLLEAKNNLGYESLPVEPAYLNYKKYL
jgi:hypothetical protein